jgi:hypothetical protein
MVGVYVVGAWDAFGGILLCFQCHLCVFSFPIFGSTFDSLVFFCIGFYVFNLALSWGSLAWTVGQGWLATKYKNLENQHVVQYLALK